MDGKPNYKIKILESREMKYPFIEYMSYRLKKYGKKSASYLKILEEQVMKMGTTVEEIIRKEHFDIAVKKVAIGNCIKSIKEIRKNKLTRNLWKHKWSRRIIKKRPKWSLWKNGL